MILQKTRACAKMAEKDTIESDWEGSKGKIMRRALSIFTLALTGAAFILLCLVLILRINVLIPIGMFAVAFILLGVVKRMQPDGEEKSGEDSENGSDAR